jgi:hypothetical protein
MVILPLIYVGADFVKMTNEPSYCLILTELKDGDATQYTGYYTENYSLGAKKI